MTYKLLDQPEQDSRSHVLASLEDEYGGRARIIEDDHCYVLQLWRSRAETGSDPGWKSITHWFREAADVLAGIVLPDKADRPQPVEPE